MATNYTNCDATGKQRRQRLTNFDVGHARAKSHWPTAIRSCTVNSGEKPLRLGPSPASLVGPFRPAPHFAVRFAVVGVPSLRGGLVVAGGGGSAVPGRVACVRVAPSSGRGSPSVCVFVARCVRAWCLCWCVVRGLWCVVCGGGVLVGLWLVCGVVGPCHSWRRFLCATPGHAWLGFAACGGVRFPATPCWGSAAGSGVWCVVCGVWCVVSGGGVLVGL